MYTHIDIWLCAYNNVDASYARQRNKTSILMSNI
jgi:hypothetical protein